MIEFDIQNFKSWMFLYFIEEKEYEIMFRTDKKYYSYLLKEDITIKINDIFEISLKKCLFKEIFIDDDLIQFHIRIDINNLIFNSLNIKKIILLSNDNSFLNLNNNIYQFINKVDKYYIPFSSNIKEFTINHKTICDNFLMTSKSIDFSLENFNINLLDNPLKDNTRYFISDKENKIDETNIKDLLNIVRHNKTIDIIIYKNKNDYIKTKNRITLHLFDCLPEINNQYIYEIKGWK